MALWQALGASRASAVLMFNLGEVERARGEMGDALVRYRSSLELGWSYADIWLVSFAFDRIAAILGPEGEAELAARLFGAAARLREEIGTSVPPVDREAYERDVAMVRVLLDKDRFDAEWVTGQAMPTSDAVRDALAVKDETGAIV